MAAAAAKWPALIALYIATGRSYMVHTGQVRSWQQGALHHTSVTQGRSWEHLYPVRQCGLAQHSLRVGARPPQGSVCSQMIDALQQAEAAG